MKGKVDSIENEDKLSFEAAVRRIENLVDTLEGKETTLSSALEVYREGVELFRMSQEKLEKMEQMVNVLNEKRPSHISPRANGDSKE